MRSALTMRILLIGLLFYSGHGTPIDPGSEDYPADGEDVPKPKSNPIIITPPQIFFGVPGQDIELPCEVQNNEEEDAILWNFNNQTIFVDKRLTATSFKDNFELNNKKFIIKNFSPQLSGEYSCQVSRKPGGYITHVVGIKESPVIETISGKKYIDVAADLTLQCKAKGFPTPSITWYRQRANNPTKEQLPSSGASLTISAVTYGDSGIYTCVASNGEAQDTKSHTVTVISGVAPESSSVPAANAKNGTRICCVFDKDRKITWSKDGKEIDLTNGRFFEDKGKHKSCLVIQTAKLEDLGSYTCQSGKVNDLQEKADIKLIGTPSKPMLKDAATDANKNPILTWDVFSLVPITNLKLFYKKPEGNEWKALPEKTPQSNDDISYVFSDLPNGTYDVKVIVSNEYGSSESIDNSAVVVGKQKWSFLWSNHTLTFLSSPNASSPMGKR